MESGALMVLFWTGTDKFKKHFGRGQVFGGLAPALNPEACGFWGFKGPRGELLTPVLLWFRGAELLTCDLCLRDGGVLETSAPTWPL